MTRCWLSLLLLVVGCSQQSESMQKGKSSNSSATPTAANEVAVAAKASSILNIGSKAPPLKVSRFLKGDPVEAFESGKVYVVEFWATWCGPCIQSMPHITELQKKHPEVTFIGVNVMERDESAAERFLATNGDTIGYRIARDFVPDGETGDNGVMNTTWLKAAAVDGIPTAFVVNQKGLIANIAHPMTLDESLSQILDGSWNLAEAADKRLAEMQEQIEAQELNQKLAPLLQNGVTAKTLTGIEELIKEYPKQAENLSLMKFQVLTQLSEHAELALEEGRHLLSGPRGKNPKFCNEVAWLVVSPERKGDVAEPLKKLALEAALQADKLAKQKHPLIADTLARALFVNGDQAAAARTQARAIELAEAAGADQQTLQEMKDQLKEYEANDLPKKDDEGSSTPKKSSAALPELDATDLPKKSDTETPTNE